MENIKNLTHKELVDLVQTWYDANKDERAIIIMAGKYLEDGIYHTQMYCGRRIAILAMLSEFVAESSKLIELATLDTLIKSVLDKHDKEDKCDKKEESDKE